VAVDAVTVAEPPGNGQSAASEGGADPDGIAATDAEGDGDGAEPAGVPMKQGGPETLPRPSWERR
jgi:hypothetical protein